MKEGKKNGREDIFSNLADSRSDSYFVRYSNKCFIEKKNKQELFIYIYDTKSIPTIVLNLYI